MPRYASHLMRTPSKNKQWNRLSAHGAPESKVIMPWIVYRLALDCFAIWSLLFLGEVNHRGETLFRLLCRCTDAAWKVQLPWITTKLPRKSDVSVRTRVRNLGRRCSVSLSGISQKLSSHPKLQS